MNKHKYKAIIVSSVAIVCSFLLWTKYINLLPLPSISEDVVSSVRNSMNSWFGAGDSDDGIASKEVIINDLGEHFATRINQAHLTASVTPDAVQEILQPAATEETEPAPVPKPEVVPQQTQQQQPVRNESEEELEQWQLSPVWSIAIPSLGIRAPILLPSMRNWASRSWNLLEEQMQVGLNHGTVAYPHSVAPGDTGNLIVAGHSSPPTKSAEDSAFGSIFAKLPDIQIGDEVRVSNVRYKVQKKFVVSPKDTSILEQQNDTSMLELITCYPVGTTKERMIVQATKIEE